jgi:hypothetical protein
MTRRFFFTAALVALGVTVWRLADTPGRRRRLDERGARGKGGSNIVFIRTAGTVQPTVMVQETTSSMSHTEESKAAASDTALVFGNTSVPLDAPTLVMVTTNWKEHDWLEVEVKAQALTILRWETGRPIRLVYVCLESERPIIASWFAGCRREAPLSIEFAT